MRSTLFTIPYKIGSLDLFGPGGVLFIAWCVMSVGLVAWLVRRQGWNKDTTSYLPLLAIVAAAIALLPRLFPDGLPIRGYGLMFLLGVVSGVALAAYQARRVGLNVEVIFSLAFWLFISGVVGARLFHVIEYWNAQYAQYDDGRFNLLGTIGAILNVPGGGLVVYGALIAVIPTLLIFFRKHRLPALAMFDLIAPSMVLGLALGRVGCLLNGCCYGGQCEAPWAVTFPTGSPPYTRQIETGLGLIDQRNRRPIVVEVLPGTLAEQAGFHEGDRLEKVTRADGELALESAQAFRSALESWQPGTTFSVRSADGSLRTLPLPARSLRVHPTQIYSAIGAALLCVFLLAYYPLRRRDGEVFALLLTIYPVTRFLLESLRIDELGWLGTALTPAQTVSGLTLLGALALWFYVLRQPPGTAFARASVTGATLPPDEAASPAGT